MSDSPSSAMDATSRGIFQPGWRPAATPSTSSGQALKRENGLFNLLPLES